MPEGKLYIKSVSPKGERPIRSAHQRNCSVKDHQHYPKKSDNQTTKQKRRSNDYSYLCTAAGKAAK